MALLQNKVALISAAINPSIFSFFKDSCNVNCNSFKSSVAMTIGFSVFHKYPSSRKRPTINVGIEDIKAIFLHCFSSKYSKAVTMLS
jgi:hypothetical protein